MQDLDRELRDARDRLSAFRLDLARAQEKVAIEEERVGLLSRLIELETPNNLNTAGDGANPGHASRNASARARLEDAVVSIIADEQEALHIGEIRERLLLQGVRIPGRGTDANIIARIIKDERIEREKGRRGFYRLSQP